MWIPVSLPVSLFYFTNHPSLNFELATAEDIEAGTAMCDDYKDAAPYWDGQPLTPEVSVREMLETIANLAVADNGTRVTRTGDKERWL